MNRTQFLAAIVALGILGALVAARVQSRSDTDVAAPATQTDSESDSESAGQTAPAGDAQNAEAAPDEAPEEVAEEAVAAEAPAILEAKPALTDLDGWLNTDASSLDDFAGQVRIVEFWTFGCFNCKNRLPHTKEIYERWHPEGLEIIGVHAPEFDFEADPAAIANAAEELGVIWPVALDTRKTNFRAWQGGRRFWPRTYVLDQNGDVRFDHIGEGEYEELAETVAYLIENGP